MECSAVVKDLSKFLDRELPEADTRGISVHLAACRECGSHLNELTNVRRLLRQMPTREVPPEVTMRIRVAASHQRARLSNRHGFWQLFWLRLNQFLRPLMVPACGGLLSSVFLFTMFVDTLDWRLDLLNDVPLGLYTSVSVDETSPFQFSGSDLLLQLTISETGNVTDFEVPNGRLSREDLRKIGNWLVFTSFNPATKYGQPTSGKVLVSFHRINVKG